MDSAYQAYVLSEDTHGRHDPLLEKQWAKFIVVFRRVGQAVQRSGGGAGVEAAGRNSAARFQRNIRPVVADRRTAAQQQITETGGDYEEQRPLHFRNLCFEYSKLGDYRYGAECMKASLEHCGI